MTWSTAMPQPAIEIPIWPVGTNTAPGSPADRAACTSSRLTVIWPDAQVTQAPAALGREARERGVGAQLVVQASLEVEVVAQRREQRLPPLVGQLAAGRGHADREAGRPELRRLLHARHDGNR